MTDWQSVATAFGLVLSLVGGVLLYLFGLPPAVNREGHIHLMLEQVDEAEAARARQYDRLGHLGIGLVIGGFAFQLVGTIIGSIK